MKTLIRYMMLCTLGVLFCISSAYGEIDLSISSPSVSVRGELYPDYQPVPLSGAPEVMPPVPGTPGGFLTITVQASNFPQTGSMHYDFYLIFRSADTGRTFYAEFDIMKLLIGGFDLSQAITLSETSSPFITDLPLSTDVEVTIPVRLLNTALARDNFYAIAVFTQAGTTLTAGSRAIDKIKVYEQPVWIMTPNGEPPATGK
ncbi:MAG: hypothetical protein HZA17_03040 [Nitrospirae bacterium]|nr:hypothetical protein [Nitrospirota bacterium]